MSSLIYLFNFFEYCNSEKKSRKSYHSFIISNRFILVMVTVDLEVILSTLATRRKNSHQMGCQSIAGHPVDTHSSLGQLNIQ